MGKLTLELETLSVESFPTTSRGEGYRGTVHGHASVDAPCKTAYDPTCDTSCNGGPNCDCPWTAYGPTCDTSCNGGPNCDCPYTPTCPKTVDG